MADPFDVLRLPTTPVAPDPRFAAALRARLEEALAPEPPDPDTVPAISLRGGDTVTTTEPTTTHALTPYLAVHDAAAALDWYRDVLGAIETSRFVGDDGRVGHAEITIGGARVMLADEYPEAGVHGPRHFGGTSVTLHLEVVDVDHSFALAVREGAEVEREPSDQFHGNRNALVRDPFGHRWMLNQPIDAVRADAAADADPGDFGDVREYAVTGRRPVEPGYITMRTGDLERARTFFGALFAWEVEPGSLEGGGHIANTRFPMGFFQAEGPAEGGPVTLYFRVDDIEPYAARVEELGGQVLTRNQYPSGGNAECVDDQGFRFDLFQPAPGY
ncbi:VOC family protein [Iamia majanohamensis]|uniref:VOC family protein n=1 Tax=Iamia majanohamensis TaxID=467976 RepID=A0AAF0BX98_9ACTN|nr:VOC family protein [Iamia majanohamensis]WCO68469.1 VOC family protein [Iamia majanohamensis]